MQRLETSPKAEENARAENAYSTNKKNRSYQDKPEARQPNKLQHDQISARN